MKTPKFTNIKTAHKIIFLLVSLVIIVLFVTCSDGITMYEPSKTGQGTNQASTTSTTGTTNGNTGGTTSDTKGGTTDGTTGGTTGDTPVVPVNVTATEIRGMATRPYYAVVSVATSDPGVTASDYYLALKLQTQPQPTANEIVNGLHYKRNLSNTPINIFAWGAVDTHYVTPTTDAEARALALTPSSYYTLYGMPNGGKDSDVKVLIPKILTNGTIRYGTIDSLPIDSMIFNSVYSVRPGENMVIILSVNTSTPVSAYVGPASTTVKPSSGLYLLSYTTPTPPTALPAGFEVCTQYLLAQGPISASLGSFLFRFGTTDYWFKTTTAF